MKEVVVVAGVLFNGEKILLAKRRASKSLGGKWEFPGGKVEGDETHKEALNRELLEEFGLDLTVENFIGSNTHDYPTFRIHLHAYKVHCPQQSITSKDHEELKWVVKDDLLSFDLAEADVPIATLIK